MTLAPQVFLQIKFYMQQNSEKIEHSKCVLCLHVFNDVEDTGNVLERNIIGKLHWCLKGIMRHLSGSCTRPSQVLEAARDGADDALR